jgi:DNA-directed RNA polymerase subunit RPC12/RpoP
VYLYENRDFGYSLYQCSICNKIHKKVFFQIETKEFTYTPQYNCEECNLLLSKIEAHDEVENDFSNIKCPCCGKKSLVEDRSIYRFMGLISKKSILFR